MNLFREKWRPVQIPIQVRRLSLFRQLPPARCFITDDDHLISNYHVVKDATKVRLLTGAGLIDAEVVQMDGTNAGSRELVSWALGKNYG
jgi:hypothetical protein